MARTDQFTLKIRLSRSERRLLGRGAKAAGASTLSGWARDNLLRLASPLSGGLKNPLSGHSSGVIPRCKLCGGVEVHKPACPNRPDFRVRSEADPALPVREDS